MNIYRKVVYQMEQFGISFQETVFAKSNCFTLLECTNNSVFFNIIRLLRPPRLELVA